MAIEPEILIRNNWRKESREFESALRRLVALF